MVRERTKFQTITAGAEPPRDGPMMPLQLDDDERAALIELLSDTIEGSRFPL